MSNHGTQRARRGRFQSSIAPKDDRNQPSFGGVFGFVGVPILDRPERRSQSDLLSSLGLSGLVPILDRPERRSQFSTIAQGVSALKFQSSIAPKDDRNPEVSPGKVIILEFQSSIAPKDDRNFIYL